MSQRDHSAGLFPALLKYWRGQRGLSQLDLALSADVSSRHVSFLETGRSTPSEAMIVRLACALDVPLRHVNAMLRAAGFPSRYPEPSEHAPLPDEITRALTLMKAHHEPFPLVVVNRHYDIIDHNKGALSLFGALLDPSYLTQPGALNLARMTFDPQGAAPALCNFDEVGRLLLWRIQRELFAAPDDDTLRALLDAILAMPTVSPDWREADLTSPSSPVLIVALRYGEHTLRFLTLVTALQAPQSVVADELRVETWLPYDDATDALWRATARA